MSGKKWHRQNRQQKQVKFPKVYKEMRNALHQNKVSFSNAEIVQGDFISFLIMTRELAKRLIDALSEIAEQYGLTWKENVIDTFKGKTEVVYTLS